MKYTLSVFSGGGFPRGHLTISRDIFGSGNWFGVSVAMVNIITKATWGGELISAFTSVHEGSQGKNLKQELKQKPQTTAAYWLAQSAFVSTRDPLPGVAQPQ